jgi:hypothetical protein
MYFKLIIIAAFAIACSKESNNEAKPPEQLLTQRPWKLVSHGSDYNNNNRIDPDEETIGDCEKDNSYNFYVNGTGLVEENLLKCTNSISEFSFNWQFTDGQKTLDFFFATLHILKMDEEQLILAGDENANEQTPRHIGIYRH